jgi:hypothetical protein
MTLTLEQVFKEALDLPDDSKASLAERLVDILRATLSRNYSVSIWNSSRSDGPNFSPEP